MPDDYTYLRNDRRKVQYHEDFYCTMTNQSNFIVSMYAIESAIEGLIAKRKAEQHDIR
jgi:hypothetical protein